MTRILLATKRAQSLQAILENHPTYTIELFQKDTNRLLERVARLNHDLLLIDVDQAQPAEVFFRQLAAISPNTVVVCLGTTKQRESAVQLLQYGASDYVIDPIDEAELSLKMRRSLEYQWLKRAVTRFPFPPSNDQSLQLLNEITQEILHTLQLDEALNVVLEKAMISTGAIFSAIWLKDPNDHSAISQKLTKNLAPEKTLINSKFVSSLVQKTQQTRTVVLRQKENNSLWAVALPLITRENLIGVLTLANNNAEVFNRETIQRMTVFCQQAAIALENAQLFNELASAYIDLSQSREEILRNRNMLTTIFDSISDGLYILNDNLTISAINRIEAEHQGYTADDLIGCSFLSLPGPGAAPLLIKQIQSAISTGREHLWIAPEAEINPHLKNREFRIYPIRNKPAQTDQVIVLANNISALRQWQASLFRSANLAAVGQLAGSVAHQINNPLTVTMANSQLLLLDNQTNSEVMDLAGGIFKAGERIQSIVGNLLEFSNQENYQFVETSLVKTIDDALALIVKPLQKANVTLYKDYQIDPIISASVSHLKLVWINLVINARDSVVEFTKEPTITISTLPVGDDHVAVAITDNGSGIPTEHLDQIFHPFFSTKLKDKAIGLGLYSVQLLTERHSGQITVNSQPGNGATFKVILPI